MAPTQIQHLAKMVNQIALNTGAQHDPAGAVRQTAEHLRKFWTPAMREQLLDYWRKGGEGLEPVVVDVLQEMSTSRAGAT